jgi:hypothetical protein
VGEFRIGITGKYHHALIAHCGFSRSSTLDETARDGQAIASGE